MSVSLSQIRHQLPMLRTIGRSAVMALHHKLRPPQGPPLLPGPILTQRVAARDPQLVQAFLSHIGSRPGTWGGALPPHLFPQWAFPLLARGLEGLPYPPLSFLNGGCRLVVKGPLPMAMAIALEVQLTQVEVEGRLAIITERCTTGTATSQNALEIEFHPIARLPAKRSAATTPGGKDKPTVPATAREIGHWALGPRAGFEFALVTGDFNPIHWIPAVARAAGFKSTILQGFASMCRVLEALVDGDGARLSVLDVRFVKPLVLPAEVGAFIDGDRIFVAERAGAEAYLTGHYDLRS